MIAKIEQLLKEVEALHASNAEELEALRIKYLSKKGAINDLMADFRNVAAEQKKEVGMRLNELKTKAQDKINALKELFESQDNDCDGLDLTRSAYPVELGTRHPLTIVKNEIIDIFARLGFSIAEGPEIISYLISLSRRTLPIRVLYPASGPGPVLLLPSVPHPPPVRFQADGCIFLCQVWVRSTAFSPASTPGRSVRASLFSGPPESSGAWT